MTKKFFHVFFSLILVLPLAFAFSSCSDDDDDEQGGGTGADLTTGSWFYSDHDVDIYLYFSTQKACAGEFYYEYGEYGKYDYEERSCEFEGEYTLSGNNVKIVIEKCDNSRECPEFKAGTVLTGTINGEKLVVKIAGYDYRFERDLDSDYDDWMDENK